MKHVVISVSGGIAETVYCPKDIKVLIVDFDNLEEKGKDPVKILDETIAFAMKREKGSHHE